jgi:thymidine phosphorylase
VPASHDGYVTLMDTEQLGMVIVDMGGGRKKVGDAVDHSVGLEMLVRVGDKVEQGQPLAQIFARPEDREWASRRMAEAIQVSEEPCSPLPLIVDRITS